MNRTEIIEEEMFSSLRDLEVRPAPTSVLGLRVEPKRQDILEKALDRTTEMALAGTLVPIAAAWIFAFLYFGVFFGGGIWGSGTSACILTVVSGGLFAPLRNRWAVLQGKGRYFGNVLMGLGASLLLLIFASSMNGVAVALALGTGGAWVSDSLLLPYALYPQEFLWSLLGAGLVALGMTKFQDTALVARPWVCLRHWGKVRRALSLLAVLSLGGALALAAGAAPENRANPSMELRLNNEFFSMISDDDLERVRVFLSRYPGSVEWKSRGRAVLQVAGTVGMARLLVNAGADPAAHVVGGYSGLSRACSEGEVELVKFYLSVGTNPNGDGVGKTPLHWAVEARNVQIVRLLLDAGADPERQDGYVLVTSEARRKGETAILKLLEDAMIR